jgi:hypothetical protein
VARAPPPAWPCCSPQSRLDLSITCPTNRCELPFRAMHIQDLAREYAAKSDEELLRLATEPDELTSTAQTALTGELAKRRINVVEHLKVPRDEGNEPRGDELADRITLPPRDSHQVSQFVADVLRVYHNHFWLFAKLIAPAVIVGYIAVFMSQHEGREIARHIPRGVEALDRGIEALEIFFLNQLGFLVSWLAFSFSFGAICFAVQQIGEGVIPSFRESFAAVRRRMGSFLRLSLLLYFLLILAVAAALLLSLGILWLGRQRLAHLNQFTIRLVAVTTMGLALLVFSRFALAIPALILDNCRVAQAVFRSDELTEKKWLTLAVLLVKSVVGGYLAGMCPFWLASLIPASVSLPWWFPWVLRVASVAAIIAVEPPMFIGFALLYIRMSATSSETSAPWQGIPASQPPPPPFTA